MVMNTIAKTGNRVFGIAVFVAMLLMTYAVSAQDETEDIGPAVDTSAPESLEEEALQSEEISPAVDTSTSSNEISRSTTGSRVMDSIELGRTEITGNQELPTVMYIVPWQKADPGDLMGKPVNTLLDEILAPIDREEFVRQVDYYNDLYGDTQE
jgi:hypothetical protein